MNANESELIEKLIAEFFDAFANKPLMLGDAVEVNVHDFETLHRLRKEYETWVDEKMNSFNEER